MFYVEFGGYGFVVVAYAARIGAFNYTFDSFGQLNLEFFDRNVALDEVYRRVWSDEGDAVDFLSVERFTLNFHYVFNAETFAGNVDCDGHNAVFFACNSQDFDYVKGVAASDVVDDCAVFDFLDV